MRPACSSSKTVEVPAVTTAMTLAALLLVSAAIASSSVAAADVDRAPATIRQTDPGQCRAGRCLSVRLARVAREMMERTSQELHAGPRADVVDSATRAFSAGPIDSPESPCGVSLPFSTTDRPPPTSQV